ncbi:synaptonemal complex protein 3-like [Haliotis rufescens]|uniref:synaptonemal complex protein 3-like n=1 Tax=Haliotis rufescens TaxID=6454 RepID=UPI00201F74EA|nr:synaptonemal complex protein 3-like [Haliotis rufescens]
MPRQKKIEQDVGSTNQKKQFDDSVNASPQSLDSSPIRADATPIVSRVGKKRTADGEGEDFGSEMQKMLECFGADISKTLVSKRRRLEQLTQVSLRSTNKKVDDIWKAQQTERHKLQGEYARQVGTVFTQWESDIDKTKEQEEKLAMLFKQQQKLFQQARIVQSQRLKTLKQLQEQFSRGVEELEQCHINQQNNVQSEMKKEMALLQKKLLMDTQQQEMANVRKSLQTMLF